MLKKIAVSIIAATFALASNAAMPQVVDPSPDDTDPTDGNGNGNHYAKGHDKDHRGKGHAKGHDKDKR